MYVALTEQELDALQGSDYALTVLYLYLKRFVDYNNGVLGMVRRISYQGMSEALYIEPRAGVKGGSPNISALRRMVDQLIKGGLLVKIKPDTLVFKMPYTDTQNYVQNKADRKSTPKPTPKTELQPAQNIELAKKADRAKTEKPTHLTNHYIINKPTSSNNVTPYSKDHAKNDDDDNILIFPKGLHDDTRQAMQNIVKGFEHEKQQELLDELAWYMQKGKVRATPEGLLIAMVNQARAGAFIAANAHRIKSIRLNPPPEKTKPIEVSAEQRQVSQTKGREKMASVHQLLKGKKTV